MKKTPNGATQVRTYAPFERGWLPDAHTARASDRNSSGLTPRLRGDGYKELAATRKETISVRTYAPFERGWLLL